METKYRTLIQAAVLFLLLVCVSATNGDGAQAAEATAQVAASE
ncbi:MAG: hypothetical protein QY325_11915 [Flavobacteriales bacterium]|nr:MAG: hypothetical protein QY325_11915 [Flavobacteriales bacterium]